jgi:branched-chain amino acid transport system substrate-binding protein
MGKMAKAFRTLFALAFIFVIFAFAFVVIYNSAQNSSKEKAIIGVSTALSGSAAFIGSSYVQGLEIAKREINENGGINGKKIELIIEDNKNEAQEGIKAFQKLKLNNPNLIISTHSVPSVPISYLADETNMPLFFSVVFADVLSNNKNSVSFFPTPADDASASVEDMKISKIKDVGVLYLNSEYGVAGAEAFINKASMNGISIKSKENFNGQENDFQTPLTKIISKNPQAIYIVGINIAPIIREAKLRYKGLIYTNLIPAFGGLIYKEPNIYEGVHLTVSKALVPGTAEYNLFLNKIKSANLSFAENNGVGYATIGYDNLNLIAEILKKNKKPSEFVGTFATFGKFDGIDGNYNLSQRRVGMCLYPAVMENKTIVIIPQYKCNEESMGGCHE